MNKVLFALALLVLAINSAIASYNPKTGPVTVLVRVIDGDTIQRGNVKVRAVGYDTPELHSKCPAERLLAVKASDRLKELTSAPHRFSLKWSKGKDKYGRGLATVYSDGKPVGPILIAEGLAHPYSGHAGKMPWPGCP